MGKTEVKNGTLWEEEKRLATDGSLAVHWTQWALPEKSHFMNVSNSRE